MRKCGFTIIELIVVIAVIALLIAITIPTLMAAKNRTRSVQCSSNLRQLSLGFVIYHQDHGIFPYGFSDKGLGVTMPEPPGGYVGSGPDKVGWWWFNFLCEVIEMNLGPNSVVWCPSRKAIGPGARRNPLCGNYGVNRPICRDAQGTADNPFKGKPLPSGSLRSPASTLLISDSGYSLLSWTAAIDAGSVTFVDHESRIDSFYIPGLKRNQSRSGLLENPDAIKGRHPHRTLNVGFADGHNEAHSAESLAIEQTITDESQLPMLWRP